MQRFIIFLTIISSISISLQGQLIPDPPVNKTLKTRHWEAGWVKVSATSSTDFGVYFFRNRILIDTIPENLLIHVSADNRYKLYINGKLIGLGPARSDADNWIYESYNISPYLSEGENIIAAEVWNYAEYKPWAQITQQTGFIVQANDEKGRVLNTPGNWKCMEVTAFHPLEIDRQSFGNFIVVGPGEKIEGALYPWGWKDKEYNDDKWFNAENIYPGTPKGVGTGIIHALVPRSIPAMQLEVVDKAIIRSNADFKEDIKRSDHLDGIKIPPNTKKSILLDQLELITAYPEFTISGGKGAQIKISYAEALYDNNGKKQHRDSVRNMNFHGYSDLIIAEGGNNRSYTNLWFRTYRYILLEIACEEEALTIDDFKSTFTAYPFEEKAVFESSDKDLDKLWDVAWRTARLCANELYYDCPYYEQLQYIGDTRVQSLISLYIAGDDRLMRKAIEDYYHSIIPEGLTLSRYPTDPRQVIPTFSLYWISMIHDYLWNRNDYLFAADYLVSIQHILQWFENRLDKNTGLMGPISYWPFVDWTKEWPWDNERRMGGVPPGALDGNSCIISFQYAMVLRQAADIFSFYGLDGLANQYLVQADEINQACRDYCWDEEKGLFADTPDKESFSMHANTFAILAGALPKEDRALFMEEILRNKELIQASLYFRFYVNRAAINSGLGNKYLDQLEPWHHMLDMGLTTLAEIPDIENTRSDCHAWSSSPIYELIHSVAGIRSASVGFSSVVIEPHPNDLSWLKATMPHYSGDISVDLKFTKDGAVKGSVEIPEGLPGIFVWDGQTLDLKAGKQEIHLRAMNERFRLRSGK